VEGYEITSLNYQVVKDLIDKEYGKTELIIDDHLKKIVSPYGELVCAVGRRLSSAVH
jgi:hypothetical protein